MPHLLKPFRDRFSALENELSSWISGYQDISDFITPTRGFFDETPNQGTTVNHDRIIDDGAGRALRTLSAGMASGLSSPSRPWFRLKFADEDLNEFQSVRLWLDEVQKRMLAVFQRSNFYAAMHSGYEELAAFGTSADILLEDFQDVIRVRNYTAGEYFLGSGPDGRIDTFARKIRMTVGQMVKEFGKENVTQQTRQMFEDNKLDTWRQVRQLIEPNDDRVPDRADFMNMPWRSVYWEWEGSAGQKQTVEDFLKRSGFEEFPVLAPRWDTKTSADIYGHGPGRVGLGDAKMLQRLTRDKLLAIAKVIDPPVQKDGNVPGEVNTLPGGVTASTVQTPDSGVRAAYQIRPDLQAINESIADARRSLNSTFYADLFLALSLRSDGRKTAREVAEIHEEKLLLLGPVIERLQSEKLGPAIERTFAIMSRGGMLPEIPPELAGVELEIEYISILAQAQKIVGVGALRDHVGFVLDTSKTVPNALDNLDVDRAMQEDGDLMGVAAGIDRSPEDIAAIREERARAEAQAAQAEQTAALLQGAETASKAKLKDGSSVLDSVAEATQPTAEAL